MALTKLTNEAGYLKAGFLGFAKSGKSFTAAKLAIGTIKLFKLDGPVALFDTESGSNYIAEMVRTETGKDLIGVRARSFDALMQFSRDCVAEKVSVAIIDSISHPWVELCDSFLAQLNESRKAKNWAPLQKLEFAQWASIKKIWEQWPNFFLNSQLHIIMCGRAGYEWEMTTNEETGRKELEKTGIKMKTEKELGFEPSLLVQMEREQVPDGQGGFKMVHTATILGDRFNVAELPAGRYRIETLKRGASCPLVEVRVGDQLAPNGVALVDGSAPLTLVLTARTGDVLGAVTSDDGKPASGIVLLAPIDADGVVQQVPINAEGRYEFRDVLAGQYRLIALSRLDSAEYLDADEATNLGAKLVHVEGGKRLTSDLKLVRK